MSRRFVPALVSPGPFHGHHGEGRLVQAPKRRRWIGRLARLGLVIRGLIYFLPGAFALASVLGLPSVPLGQVGSIELVGRQPMGRALLVVVAIGLAGYAGWGVYRAFFDAQRRGHKAGGILLRIGYAGSAIAYLGMLLGTIHLLAGTPAPAAPQADWSVSMLARPFGGVVVAIAGLCWIFGSGIAQIVTGWSHAFDRDLVMERMGPAERGWAVGLGRVGLVSRGLVFTIIGVLLVAGAFHAPARPDAGLTGALVELGRQPLGRALAGFAAAGLMVFGVYSAMCARWMRMDANSTSASPPSSHPNAS